MDVRPVLSFQRRGRTGSAVRCRLSGTSGSRRRTGITLFEVVLALSVFLVSIALISQILRNGSRANTKARLSAEAALRADSKMNEVVCGSLPLQSVSAQPFDDGDTNWSWSLSVSEAEIPGLLELQLTVEFKLNSGEASETFQLVRLMRDPQSFIDAAASSTSTGGT